jgi:transcriptional regulator with XRE-family HTH domain
MAAVRKSHFLKEWRQYMGMTQGEFARYVGMSSSNYNYLEGGKIGYTQNSLEMIADKLEVTPATLISVDPLLPEHESHNHTLGGQLDRIFEELSVTNQVLAIDLVSTLRKHQVRNLFARFKRKSEKDRQQDDT